MDKSPTEQPPAGENPRQSPLNASEQATSSQSQSRKPVATLLPPQKYDVSIGTIKRILFGEALTSSEAGHHKLPKILALPIFSSDALSSVAYATEAILGVLIVAGTGALTQSVPIALAICLLILIVSFSYRQVIFEYPNGGGAYPVAKENLGSLAALVAGAALLIDYALTVAVSVASGVDAIGSFSSVNVEWLHLLGVFVNANTVAVCVVCTLGIMFANLRGVKESGAIFAVPSYAFIVSFAIMLIAGFAGVYLTHSIAPPTVKQFHTQAMAHGMMIGTALAGTYLVLQAFSSGCSALTGLEAISNTVPSFAEPRAKNAAATMVYMALIAVFFVGGCTKLADIFHSLPLPSNDQDYQTVISQIAHVIFDRTPFSWFYFVIQITTAIILILAANTAFAGFPQLASMLARDSFLPRQLATIGDRLVFNNGIVVLAIVGCALIMIFQGDVYELIPLYAIGVFTSFTLAQGGMVRRWLRLRHPGWFWGVILNGIGAVATALVAIIFVVSKWASGVAIDPKFEYPTHGVMQWYHGYRQLTMWQYRHWQHVHPGATLPGFTIGPGLTPHYGAWLVVVLTPLMVLLFRKIAAHYKDYEDQLSLDNYSPKPRARHIVIVLVSRLHRGVVDSLMYAQSISPDCQALYIETDETATEKLKANWEQWSNGIPLIVIHSQTRSLFRPIINYISTVQREYDNELVTIVVPEFVPTRWWHNLLHNQAGLILKLALAFRPGIVVSNVRYFFTRTPTRPGARP